MNEEPEQNKPEDKPIIPARPEPSAEKAEPAPAEQAETPAEEQAAAPAEPAAEPKKRKTDIVGIVVDTLLVGLLVGAIGGGCWYLHKELAGLRVLTPMELAMQKKVELCQQREALQGKAYHADEQLHMRRRLASLVEQQRTLQRKIEEGRQAVENAHQQVLGLQHEIRQEDKTSRSVAKGLLPGLFIGDAPTTTGRVHRNATIHRIEGNRISLRSPEGQVRFPVRELVKDNLPDIARYAFGLDDLVDMSDFELTPGEDAPKPRKGKLIKQAPAAPAASPADESAPDAVDYEGDGGAPVVDTDANRTSTLTGEGGEEPDGSLPTTTETWQPPAGDLPL